MSLLVASTEIVADSQSSGEAIGRVIGFLLFPALGVLLLVLGNRKRAATQGAQGKGLVIAGWIVLVLGVLGVLGALAQQSGSS